VFLFFCVFLNQLISSGIIEKLKLECEETDMFNVLRKEKIILVYDLFSQHGKSLFALFQLDIVPVMFLDTIQFIKNINTHKVLKYFTE
jgi:hypothetical protein